MPRGAKQHPTRRLNLELSEDTRERLESLQAEMKADSITEVIRRAIALLDRCWTSRRKGSKVVLKNKGIATELEFF